MEQAKVVYSSEQIAEAIKKVADKINLDYKDSTHPIVAVCLLKGAVLFYADLVRHLNIPVRLILCLLLVMEMALFHQVK